MPPRAGPRRIHTDTQKAGADPPVVILIIVSTEIGTNVPRFVGVYIIIVAVVEHAVSVQRNKTDTAYKNAMKHSRELTVFLVLTITNELLIKT